MSDWLAQQKVVYLVDEVKKKVPFSETYDPVLDRRDKRAFSCSE